ncbi:histidine kinase [Anaeromyxobacter dehalogenans 2CP-1]|uniref:histidine kinase n=1 Tax=Anaeromyxobacter dehalogenans (strain ATCC BAA-258 / DSM 21875 / 2CP-1) TaxID=455488 RepID=B8J7X5_ANAD2|nr:HAMP domain-containing sensor histidine kinase [Anaeromyxobacter dehalogenans]ACL63467.1 histidine kinase [Anaeromyxobacter dehalogenans 2CP-1]
MLEAADAALRAAVADAVREARRRSAEAVAWMRVALRGAILLVYLPGWHEPAPWHAAALRVSVAYLAFAGGVLALLRRRWRWEAVALGAAAIDLAVVAVGSWRVVALAGGNLALAVAAGAGNGMMLMVILFAALALPAAPAAAISAVAVANQMALAAHSDVSWRLVLVVGLMLSAAAFVAIRNTMRATALAARLAAETYTASLCRAHGEAMARASAEAVAQRDEVVAAHRQARDLVRLMVHDLKNPLAALLQYLRLAEVELRGQPGAGPVREDLAQAEGEGQRLSEMIGDLLAISRLETGPVRLAADPVSVGDLLQAVARSCAPHARERGVTLSVRGGEDLVVRIDRDLSRRLLENLVSNALRHCRTGDRVELAGEADGEGVRLAVRNSGPPVPAAIRAHLFEKFAPGEAREWTSAGLGLYLCRLVAEAHGGGVALVDTPGWTVSFEARLAPPQAGGEAAPHAAALAPERRPG